MNISNLKTVFIDNKIYRKEELITGFDTLIGNLRQYKIYGRIEFINYIIVGFTEERINKTVAENFVNSSLQYAEANYDGKGFGNNSGLVSISVLVGKDIDRSAIDFFKHSSRIHAATREISILYDINKDEFYKPNFFKFPLWGLLFLKYYSKLTAKVMGLIRSANTLQSNHQ